MNGGGLGGGGGGMSAGDPVPTLILIKIRDVFRDLIVEKTFRSMKQTKCVGPFCSTPIDLLTFRLPYLYLSYKNK